MKLLYLYQSLGVFGYDKTCIQTSLYACALRVYACGDWDAIYAERLGASE